MPHWRLQQQIQFILEADKLKEVFRRSYVLGADRRENDSEHSWHLAVMALTLSEHTGDELDIFKVVQMCLLHDLVEIDAGDTYIYDEKGREDKKRRELLAADRLFGLLPEDQAREFRRIWDEFEKGDSLEARFAHALDRLMPLLHNYHTQGKSWQEHDITKQQVITRMAPIRKSSSTLWEYAQYIINDAVSKGYLADK